MKGFLEEYGLIIVVVAVILLMLLFGKSGYAKSIQDAILGSADHIVETGENITKKEVNVKASDIVEIEGTKYLVLEQKENSQALVITASSIGNRKFQSAARSDGKNPGTYEVSEIDNYLENNWYKGLLAKMQSAIQATNIKQTSYDGVDSEYDFDGLSGKPYNTISRHVFLPSASEISKVVDLKNEDKVKAFLNGANIWTRHSYSGDSKYVVCLTNYGATAARETNYWNDVRPAFVIDLSKVDYTEAGHVDYK